jgi:hypothetical protein
LIRADTYGVVRRLVCRVLAAVVSAGLLTAGPAGAGPEVEVITYSVQGRGNVSSLESFAADAAATYGDPRGWSLGGSIRFDRVASGGDFTLWLAADALMSTFGGACDVVWSCRNGRNVVVNESRWLGASDSWNTAGAPLATYRQMVLNHETGHWLGFGHAFCSGAGRPAPVMQQQSMALKGCGPNPWPLVSEQARLAARRDVPLIQSGSGSGPSTTTSSSTTTSEATTTTTAKPAGPAATTTTTARGPAGGSSSMPREDRCLARMPRVALRSWRRCL